MISSSEEVQDVGEAWVAFSSDLNTENMFMRPNITNMQTNFSNQIPQKYRLNTQNDNKIIELMSAILLNPF